MHEKLGAFVLRSLAMVSGPQVMEEAEMLGGCEGGDYDRGFGLADCAWFEGGGR